MENYDSRGSDCEHDECQKPKEEPHGATQGLRAGLGNAEGAKERGCEGFQESHAFMVRGWIAGRYAVGLWAGNFPCRGWEAGKESTGAREHPIGDGLWLAATNAGG